MLSFPDLQPFTSGIIANNV